MQQSKQRAVTTNAKRNEEDQEDDSIPRITYKYLKMLLRSNFKLYYSTFELNQKLYLHYKGFQKIQGLDAFTDLKVLYFEGNGLKKIENLDKNTKLSCLYLQQNCIKTLENLDQLTQLNSLNVSDNFIQKIQGLSNLNNLSTIQLKNNRIGMNGVDDVIRILECPSITVLDLSNNRIEDEAVIHEVIVKMPELRVLYLQGNGVVKKVKNYRKFMTSWIPTLKYLDDKPVFDQDRRYAQAFVRGGIQQERKQRALVRMEKQQADQANREGNYKNQFICNLLAFRKMLEDAREQRIANSVARDNNQQQQQLFQPYHLENDGSVHSYEDTKASLSQQDSGSQSGRAFDFNSMNDSNSQPADNESSKSDQFDESKSDTKSLKSQKINEDFEDLPPQLEKVDDNNPSQHCNQLFNQAKSGASPNLLTQTNLQQLD